LRLDDEIIDIGCGASLLIDNLIGLGYQKMTAVDHSEAAITKLKNISLWHDRAVLHFLVEEEERQTYKKILTGTVRGDRLCNYCRIFTGRRQEMQRFGCPSL